MANLKDIKHPALKENVLQGVIAPERFAKMTSEVKRVKEKQTVLYTVVILQRQFEFRHLFRCYSKITFK